MWVPNLTAGCSPTMTLVELCSQPMGTRWRGARLSGEVCTVTAVLSTLRVTVLHRGGPVRRQKVVEKAGFVKVTFT